MLTTGVTVLYGSARDGQIIGEILVYAQCPSCPLPFRPSEMPFPQNDLPFNALHQNALSVMPIQICPFKTALSLFALPQFALYQNALSEMPFQMSFIKMPFR